MTNALYRNRWLIAYGNFIFHYRNTVFPLTLVALLVVFPPARPAETGENFAIDLLALLVAFLGESIRILTVGLEYIKRGGLNRRIYASNLVTHGVFAHCRNPLYLGNVLLALALLTISDDRIVLIIGAPLVIVTYVAIVAAEEHFLKDNFGAEFDEYCSRTNRWWPEFAGFAETMRSMRFNWQRVLLKETNTIYGWIVLACLVEAFAEHFTGLFQDLDFKVYLAMAVIATVCFLIIRVLKWTHTLRSSA
jgi:protein-S-isoprenylcysteine O-methyltransferase Ste14